MTSVTETPPETLKAATDENALPSGKLALLGTFTGTGEGRALIRTASGRIETVTPGASIGTARVVAIKDGKLVIARGERTTTLTMPRG